MNDMTNCARCGNLEHSDGTCRESSPSVVLVGINEQGKPMTMTIWPRISNATEQWCAKFSRASRLVVA